MASKKPAALSEFIQALKNGPEFHDAVVHHHHIAPKPPDFGPDPLLDDRLTRALARLGIHRLYRHQTDAIEHLRRGDHVIVATPTASGKSLIYNLAVLEAVLNNPQTKALYIFPLKALEQDQLKNLRQWMDAVGAPGMSAEIYDGDTATHKRKKIRSNPPQILFTTPDMLHHGILAFHGGWEALLRRLDFVILDEVHTYRGIFGSHVNQVIRRLKRLCRHYGSRPRFVLLSATVSNPKQFAQALIGEQVQVVETLGAPVAGRQFLFLNPMESANFAAAKLFVHAIKHGFRTIAFTQSRKVAELIHIWASQLAPRLGEKISSYRAGFLPEERRDIEQRLAAGRLLGVVSTSALEMGIDIGYLDICLLVGYPGTVIDTWQRGGRVGRSGRESAVILIAKPDALDQYFMKHPEDFFQRSYEAAVLDPRNPHVINAHLPCAAVEKPITLKDHVFWGGDLASRLDDLERQGILRRSAESAPVWFAAQHRPHRRVDMRCAGERFSIFDKETRKPIGAVDGIRAFKECHPGAVYLHRGRQYVVEDLHIAEKDIMARMARVSYFTRVKSDKETEVLQVNRSRPQAQFVVREGRVKVTEVVTGYEKRALPGRTLIGTPSLELPPQVFETVGVWIEIDDVIKTFVEQKNLHFMGGIHAVEHGVIGMFPLFCLCDRNDIGGIAYDYHPGIEKSAVFIYDGYPGGVGLAQHGFDVILELLEKTLSHLKTCPCEAGCPSCIHSPKCGSGNKPLDKQAAVLILECLVGRIPLAGPVEKPVQHPKPFKKRPRNTAVLQKKTEPRILFFDLETQKLAREVGGWQNIHLMHVSVAVVFDTRSDDFKVFEEDRVEALLNHLQRADLVVGFNVRQFDYRVLSAYTGRPLDSIPTFDILEDIYRRLGFRLSLDHLASETLSHAKTADGLQAVQWFRQGHIKKLTDYCRNDVAITRDLFLYGMEKAHLVYREKQRNQRVRLPVDWNLDDIIRAATDRPPGP
jgi:DEAD/DEAH box helicase domain-containing protein